MLQFYWMHNANATLRLTEGQSFLFYLTSRRKGKDLKVQQQSLTSNCLELWGGQHAQKGRFPSLELAAACGVVSTCRSLHRSVQEPGFYPGRCTAIATPCPPQGKICLPKLFWKGWLLWKQKQQWVKLRQCPVLVRMFSCSEQLDCKAGDAGY